MLKNVLDYLEISVKKFPDKTVFSDDTVKLSYSEFYNRCRNVGTALYSKGYYQKVIAVYMDQSVSSLVSAFGIVYSGSAYVIIDSKMPLDRIQKIFDTVHPSAMICSSDCFNHAEKIGFDGELLIIDDLIDYGIDDDVISKIRSAQIDTDPLYILFTSGSTGNPKGTVVNHRNVISYISWFCEAFSLDENTVSGNQTPFYFSMSVSDVYGIVFCGGTLNIIPKKLFSFPVKLLEFLNERKVNFIYWVPSALCIVADWKALDYVQVPLLKKVLFAGEVMPSKQLNYWRQKTDNAMFANLFGPTETTDICCYYIIDRTIENSESVPIGYSCNNCECLIINENGKRAGTGEIGEMYVRGSFVASGYFGDAEKTKAAFVQNPLQSCYPETVYKTGDLVRINGFGEMEYVSRKDFQIKHMGYRIELGEIEAAANSIDDIKVAVVIYDKETDSIILIYNGKKFDEAILCNMLSNKIPDYMMPTKIIRTREMPYNANGKIDRSWLGLHYNEL